MRVERGVAAASYPMLDAGGGFGTEPPCGFLAYHDGLFVGRGKRWLAEQPSGPNWLASDVAGCGSPLQFLFLHILVHVLLGLREPRMITAVQLCFCSVFLFDLPPSHPTLSGIYPDSRPKFLDNLRATRFRRPILVFLWNVDSRYGEEKVYRRKCGYRQRCAAEDHRKNSHRRVGLTHSAAKTAPTRQARM